MTAAQPAKIPAIRTRYFRVGIVTALAQIAVTTTSSVGEEPDPCSLVKLMVSGWTSGDVHVYDACTGDYLRSLDQTGDLAGAMTVVRGPDQNLYVASEQNDRVIRYDGRTGAMIDLFVWDDPATAGVDETGGLAGPTGVAFGLDGNLYVAGFDSDNVLKYDGASGAFLGVFVSVGSGGLDGPDAGMVFGPDGHLYVPSFESDAVLEYDGSSGAFLRVFADSLSGLANPRTVLFRDDGRVLVSSWGNGRILEYDGSSGGLLRIVASRVTGASGMAFGPDGLLYVTSDSQDRVWQYDADTGERLATFVATGSGGLDSGTYVFFGDLTGCSPAEAPVIDAGSVVKSRYLSLVPGAAIQRQAFRVTFFELAGFPDSNGEALWIGPPSAYPEEDLSDPARVFLASGLQCEPYFNDWSTIDLLKVYGAEIMPQSRYQIQAIHEDCAVAIDDPVSYTPPVEMLTGKFGDAVFPFFDGTPDSQQPDFKDISGLVAKFLAAPDAPEKAMAQLQPNVVIPTRSIDFKDISNAVNSFSGTPYTGMLFATGPCTCPSSVTCASDACIADSECGGGFCLGGFCTDACGRCAP